MEENSDSFPPRSYSIPPCSGPSSCLSMFFLVCVIAKTLGQTLKPDVHLRLNAAWGAAHAGWKTTQTHFYQFVPDPPETFVRLVLLTKYRNLQWKQFTVSILEAAGTLN